jgi:undecaprenyl-phosphate 4-deoxy-4-formamido-L-arabinose transferase
MSDYRNCSIIIPVYYAEKTLSELVLRLQSVLPSLFSQYELLLVNDGSRDGSWEIISALAKRHSWIHGINLMRNYGQHNAILCGIRQVKYDTIITMDDDLQHPPEEIHKLLEKLDEGFDVVYGSPEQEVHSIWRNLASQLTKLALQGTMGAQTARKVSAFRAFRTLVTQAFQSYQNSYVNIDVLLTWGTDLFTSVPVRHDPRYAGESRYTFRKLMVHAINMVTGFSVLPLQIASWMGFAFALFGGLVLVYVIGRYLIQGGSVPGFPFLASTIAIFSGVQLFALGIIGEYLSRMHFRLMDRPPYLVRSDLIKGDQ